MAAASAPLGAAAAALRAGADASLLAVLGAPTASRGAAAATAREHRDGAAAVRRAAAEAAKDVTAACEKVVMVFGFGGCADVGDDAGLSVFGAVEKALGVLVAVSSGATINAGEALLAGVRAAVGAVAHAACDVVDAASRASVLARAGEADAAAAIKLAPMAGVVAQRAAELEKAAFTNCAACGRAVAKRAREAKAAAEELREMMSEAQQALAEGGGSEGGRADADVCADDSDYDDALELDSMNAAELAVARAAAPAVQCALDALKACVRACIGAAHDERDSLEALLAAANATARSAEELVAALYAPQDHEEVSTASAALRAAGMPLHAATAAVRQADRPEQGAAPAAAEVAALSAEARARLGEALDALDAAL
eukprot:PRCOL_00006971-RA